MAVHSASARSAVRDPDADVRLDSRALSEIVRASPVAIAFGTLAQQSTQVRAVTVAVLDGCPDALRFCDANLRDGWDGNLVDELLRSSNVIQPNEGEAGEIALLRGLPAQDHRAFMAALADESRARAICVTRGADGAVLLLDDRFVEGRPAPIVPIDTVGAGDAFAAALLDGILVALRPEVILQRAIALGALVATRRGATPVWDGDELQAILDVTPMPSIS